MPLGGTLERLVRLRPVRFEWKDPAEHGGREGPQMGFVAQQVEEVFPEWVETSGNGYKMITATGMQAVLVQAIKQQQRAIADKDKQISELRRKNKAQDQRLRELESLAGRVRKLEAMLGL